MFIHDIDPVFMTVGSLSLYWYGLMWALAFLTVSMIFEKILPLKDRQQESLVVHLAFGTVVGAKLGYILFYAPASLWLSLLFSRSGLAFHGGLLGFIAALWFWARKYHYNMLYLADSLVVAIPWGLLWGRVGNFLNSELWGYPTNVPWAVVFQRTDPLLLPRHPSQLYEAFGEGLLLGLILLVARKYLTKEGCLSFLFILGYGGIRFVIEFFRVPDSQLGLYFGLSQGQWLCLVMVIFGIIGIVSCYRRTEGVIK